MNWFEIVRMWTRQTKTATQRFILQFTAVNIFVILILLQIHAKRIPFLDRTNIVEILLENGAESSSRNKKGKTPIDIATEKGEWMKFVEIEYGLTANIS